MSTSYEHAYLHVPFCGRRCSYCDFAIAVRKDVPADEFVSAVHAELSVRFPEPTRWPLRTIYLGGGTPSKLGPRAGDITKLMASFAGVEIDGLDEVTLEANPEDLSESAAQGWRRGGVNRVSLGVQSFQPEILQWMHRSHGPAQVDAAVRHLRRAGIGSLSLDLIFALPERLVRDWDAELSAALALEPDHLSVYGLTVETHTPLGRWTARGEEQEATDDRWAEQFLRTHERLSAEGFEHYEVSNYARPGARAVHNSAYWRGVPFLGIGPSAHGFDGERRRWNEPAYAAWQRRVALGEDPRAGDELLDAGARAAERVYLGLRTVEGLPATPVELRTAEGWVRHGWATVHEGRIRCTPEGWMRLDRLAVELIDAVA